MIIKEVGEIKWTAIWTLHHYQKDFQVLEGAIHTARGGKE